MRVRRQLAGGVSLLLAVLAESAPASGQLQAGPTLLEISPQTTSARLTLRNTRPYPVAAQVRIFAWSQPGGEDHLEPSEDLAVSPPIIELPAGGVQLVRIVRLGAPPQGRDRSYRVVVDELPRDDATSGSRVELRMRYVIPAFVRAPDGAAPSLSCLIEAGGARLACENSGGRAAQLGASSLLDDRSDVLVLSTGLLGYVLPDSRRVWRLPSARPEVNGINDETLRLDTWLNGQPTTVVVGRVP